MLELTTKQKKLLDIIIIALAYKQDGKCFLGDLTVAA